MTDEDLKALKALEAKATPRPWEVDHINNPGEYGSGDDTHAGFYSYAIYSNGKALLDTSNSEVAMVHVEPDEFGETAWDEQGCCDLVFIASARNALPSLISGLEEARGEVARLRAALEKISMQKKSAELDTEYDVEFADFEEGYDACIEIARQAVR